MNKFITTDVGGLPIVLDDFRFIDDSVRNAFFGLAGAFGNTTQDGYRLQGASLTPNAGNFDVEAGYIVFNGEIFQVNAATVPPASVGQRLIWSINTAYDSAGSKTFDSGATFDTYQLRTAHVISALVTPASLEALDTPTIHDKIEALKPDQTFETIDLAGDPDVMQNDNTAGTGNDIALTTLPQAGDYLRYNINGKIITINFYFQVVTTTNTASAASSLIIKNLPFTFENINQNGVYVANSGITEAASGTHPVKMEAASNRLVFQLLSTQGNNLSFNRKYALNAVPAKLITPTADVLTSFGWIVSGSVTGVLQ